MKYVKFLVALLAACMLVMPAFSMPNFGDNAKDGKALIDAPCQSPAAPEDPHGQQPCDCKDKKAPKSMMGGKCDKPMMGPEGDKFAPKSMMDEKARCGEMAPKMDDKQEKPMMDEQAPKMDAKEEKPMMDEQAPKMDDKAPCEQAPKMDEKAPCGHAPKSMMDGKFAPQDGPKGGKCAPKSMMPEKAPCQKPFDGQDDKAPMQDCPCPGK
ncbi:MAG: hypothetical protein EHM14_00900 [Methanothrix sp.]|nr:MAG: hypothetical protein EHM14_00900 [Methanothrix sp.]